MSPALSLGERVAHCRRFHQPERDGLRFEILFAPLWLAYWFYVGGDHFWDRFLIVPFPLGIFALLASWGEVVTSRWRPGTISPHRTSSAEFGQLWPSGVGKSATRRLWALYKPHAYPAFPISVSATRSLLTSGASIHVGLNVLQMLRRSAPNG